ncbi:MAG TPA: polysaccharide deacetylase, partial [Nitrospirae bacterium]|nr:polysaccharide deacetylase [Nitrospirota bacterium]
MKTSNRIILLLSYLILMTLCFSTVALSAEHAVVLQYHHFGDNMPPSTSITLEQFDQQLKYLSENEYNVWPLEKIVAYLREKKELPDRCVAITIDDAYVSVYEEAFPRLKKLGYPFTVFVPTEGVEKGIKSYLTWEQMREMQGAGAVFASHSHSHDYLIRRQPGETEDAWIDRVINDIDKSLNILKEKLGSASKLFAYPYGEYNISLKQIIRSLGLTGFGQQSGGIWYGSDFAALPRFPMAANFAEMDQFITKVRSMPLPVISVEPGEPVLPHDVLKPVLRLTLAPGDYLPDSLTCYSGEQGRINVRWLDRDKGIVEIVPNQELSKGRSRYNCTARHKKEDRYFWYSHL